MNTISIKSPDQLIQYAKDWNRLWEKSNCDMPTVRAEPLANFVREFQTDGDFLAIVVIDRGRWVAALPMLVNKRASLVRIGNSTSNPWSFNHDFLLACTDKFNVDIISVADAIKKTLQQEKVQALKFDWVDCHSPNWTKLIQGFRACHSHVAVKQDFFVGTIELNEDWPAYQTGLSSSFRKKLRQSERRLSQLGTVRCFHASDHCGGKLSGLIKEAFELENRSWKGKQGSSAIQSPGMFDFYQRQATLLAETNHFQLQFLMLDETPIAFDFGYQSDSTYYSHKVSFDPKFAKFGPGQLLSYRQLEHWYQFGPIHTVNTMGPISDATRRWATSTYPRGNMLISIGEFPARDICRLYSSAQGVCRSWFGRQNTDSHPAAHPESSRIAQSVAR